MQAAMEAVQIVIALRADLAQTRLKLLGAEQRRIVTHNATSMPS